MPMAAPIAFSQKKHDGVSLDMHSVYCVKVQPVSMLFGYSPFHACPDGHPVLQVGLKQGNTDRNSTNTRLGEDARQWCYQGC